MTETASQRAPLPQRGGRVEGDASADGHRQARVRPERSVFVKLFAVMLGLGLLLPLLVAGFVILFVRPAITSSAEALMGDSMQLFAASHPTFELARETAARRRLDIRYEGPDGGYTTDERLPPFDQVLAALAHPQAGSAARELVKGTRYELVSLPDGSKYLFAWAFRSDLAAAHNRALVVLIALIAAIVFAAHVTLRRALGPLESLHAGVAALGEGDLEVRIPTTSRDEFGALSEAFNRMVARVRDMVRSRDQLLLDVSHELRSPLTRMKVALALGPGGEHAERLSRNIAEMESLVTELLELERLRQGKGLRIESGDLAAMVRDVVRECGEEAPGVKLGELPAELRLPIDAEKIRRVLSNLIENACKYSLPDSGPVVVSLVERDGVAEVRVEDDGPGIPEECLGSVFEPFFRVDPSRSRRTGGYGLGLSLCQRILWAHGGEMRVENRRPRGAVLTIRFAVG